MRDEGFVLKQMASYSDTAAHDRSAVDAWLTHALPVAGNTDLVLKILANKLGASAIDFSIMPHLAFLADASLSKLSLAWILGDTVAVEVLTAMGKVRSLLQPRQEVEQLKILRKGTTLIGKIESLLVDETKPVTDEAFFKSLTTSKMEQVRKLRADAKASLNECRAFCEKSSTAVPIDVQAADEVLERAFFQTVRFGIRAFMNSSEIAQTTESAVKIRGSLKAIWALHATNEKITKYLGDGFVKRMTDVLKMCEDCLLVFSLAAFRTLRLNPRCVCR